MNTLETKSMLIHSSKKVTGSTLELSVKGNQVELVRSFKFLGVTINDTRGPITSTRPVPRCPTTSIFFAISLGFFLSLFFSSLNITFSFSSTNVMLSGLGAPSLRLPGWRPYTTMPAALSSVNVKGPLHWLLVGN